MLPLPLAHPRHSVLLPAEGSLGMWHQHHPGLQGRDMGTAAAALCHCWGHLLAPAGAQIWALHPTAPLSPRPGHSSWPCPPLGLCPKCFFIAIIPQSQPELLWLQLAPTGVTSRNFLKTPVFVAVPKGWEQSGSCGHWSICPSLVPGADPCISEQDLPVPVPLSSSVSSVLCLGDGHHSLLSPKLPVLSFSFRRRKLFSPILPQHQKPANTSGSVGLRTRLSTSKC